MRLDRLGGLVLVLMLAMSAARADEQREQQAKQLYADGKKAYDAHDYGRAVDLFASVRSKVHLGSALRTLGEITAAGGWGSAHTKSAREYFAHFLSHVGLQQFLKRFTALGRLSAEELSGLVDSLTVETFPAGAASRRRRHRSRE